MISLAFTIVGTGIAVIGIIFLLWVAICCLFGIGNAIAKYPALFLWLAVIVVLMIISNTVPGANAQGLHLPPVEFDKPYPGKITVETVTNAQLRAQCENANMSSLGCAFPGLNSCRILLVDEASIKAVGWTVELILRHERAHCNGWPQSHAGKRPYP